MPTCSRLVICLRCWGSVFGDSGLGLAVGNLGSVSNNPLIGKLGKANTHFETAIRYLTGNNSIVIDVNWGQSIGSFAWKIPDARNAVQADDPHGPICCILNLNFNDFCKKRSTIVSPTEGWWSGIEDVIQRLQRFPHAALVISGNAEDWKLGKEFDTFQNRVIERFQECGLPVFNMAARYRELEHPIGDTWHLNGSLNNLRRVSELWINTIEAVLNSNLPVRYTLRMAEIALRIDTDPDDRERFLFNRYQYRSQRIYHNAEHKYFWDTSVTTDTFTDILNEKDAFDKCRLPTVLDRRQLVSNPLTRGPKYQDH